VDRAAGFVAHYDTGGGVDEFSDAAVVPEVDLGEVRGRYEMGEWEGKCTSLPQTPT
jgi:hypothetical protein